MTLPTKGRKRISVNGTDYIYFYNPYCISGIRITIQREGIKNGSLLVCEIPEQEEYKFLTDGKHGVITTVPYMMDGMGPHKHSKSLVRFGIIRGQEMAWNSEETGKPFVLKLIRGNDELMEFIYENGQQKHPGLEYADVNVMKKQYK